MEVQLNELLEKLATHKQKLPSDDHLVVDWIISAIQIRQREKEVLMAEIDKKLKSLKDEYKKDLDKSSDKNSINKVFQTHLRDLVDELSCLYPNLINDAKFEDCVSEYVDILQKKVLGADEFNKIIRKANEFCEKKAKNLGEKINQANLEEEVEEQAKTMKKCYEKTSKILKAKIIH